MNADPTITKIRNHLDTPIHYGVIGKITLRSLKLFIQNKKVPNFCRQIEDTIKNQLEKIHD